MTRLGTPVALRWGSCDLAAPLIVLFHGRNATETDMAWRAPYLPDGAAYASVRALLAEGRGFAWFANGGTGRPLPDSLAVTMAWFREWLDERATIGPRRGGRLQPRRGLRRWAAAGRPNALRCGRAAVRHAAL